MRLFEVISRETGASIEKIGFLRHANRHVKKLQDVGGTIDELNRLQDVGSKYDILFASVSVVAIIVNDEIEGIYSVAGVEREGRYSELASPEFKKFEGKEDSPVVCRKYALSTLTTGLVGARVTGWTAPILAVCRHDHVMFPNIEVDCDDRRLVKEKAFNESVAKSMRDTREARRLRLERAKKRPDRLEVTTYIYVRNPDVVAEVLDRAKGVCEECKGSAPFLRRSDGTPYLEVHHKTQLLKGGEDTVENAIALCPNCHRAMHFG